MSRIHVPPIPASEITPEPVWQGRRRWLKQAAAMGALAGAGPAALAAADEDTLPELKGRASPEFSVMDKPTVWRDITGYNNFYEFGTDKSDPRRNAHRMVTEPWTVVVEGEVLKPRTFDIDALRKLAAMEERVYRLRCVEAWSMVIPWVGYPLSELLKQVEPTGNARYVTFETALQPDAMPGTRRGILDWPYVEALRMDEAMHPLTLLVFGLYGKVLPNQNGAPLRLAVPWKYGFKSGKSIVRIRCVEEMPRSSWMIAAPTEYGFYANVNPDVPHPRWSQATERRIGDHILAPRVKTRMFNGYAEQVAGLYSGMDLRRDF
ncbi:MAG TPA: protein-methionine-sulfoxide reductase catalytic subunit MsrP [Burkholderiaceae bacterium]|jgi:sulfoxide reductase catalytic subunit YedY|nr:protein-methionine-sulfoxide reductase catalytic subunit MsrP [Burkholderiaceae bacterium]